MNVYTSIHTTDDDEISIADLPLRPVESETPASVTTEVENIAPVEAEPAEPEMTKDPSEPTEAPMHTDADDASATDAQPPLVPAVPTETTTSAVSMPDGYALLADGVYVMPADETAAPVFICTPLRVDATFADGHSRGWGRLVSMQAADGRWHEIPITNADLQRSPADVIARLVDHGLDLAPGKKSKDLLLDLLRTWKPDQHLVTVNRMGWSDETHTSFVLGSRLVGSAQVLPLAPATGIAAGLVETGDIGAWRANIGAACSGNPLMILAVSLAFSGPLLAMLGMHGGGLHFRGASSSGKTTLLNIAASVWGDRRLITSWRATSNGLEAIASTMNDMLLPLDEIAEMKSRDLYDAIYMLANGAGKARMTKDATLADQVRWRLALISSGEVSIEEMLKAARLDAMAGQTTWSQLFPDADGQKAAAALRDMQILVADEDRRLTRKAPRAIPGRPRLYTVITDRVTAYKIE